MNRSEIYSKSIRHFLASIHTLIDDPSVSEIMVNGHGHICVERRGRIIKSSVQFASEDVLMAAAQNIAEYNHRTLDESNLAFDGHLPDGSRIHVIVPPAATSGIHMTIRKFQKSSFDLGSLIKRGSLSPAAAEFLNLCVKLRKNIVISGGTGTGKTSVLNALSACIPDDERVIVIEDTAELQLNSSCHTVSLEAQQSTDGNGAELSIRDLFVNSLRMRPDRIIVGEVRRGEALDLIQSMLSGHSGALTTVHASSPRNAVTRLETLCLMSETELPVYVARQQVSSAVNIVVQLVRLSDGRRCVQSVSECCGLNLDGQHTWNELFHLQTDGQNADGTIDGSLVMSGTRPSFYEEPSRMGLQQHVNLCDDLFPTCVRRAENGPADSIG